MNGRERILGMIRGEPVDHLPFMPITMMFAADVLGVSYRQYATDFRELVEAQIRTVRMFDIDYVSCISDPAREATDLGAQVEFFDHQPPAIVESQALLADKSRLNGLQLPDLSRLGRMKDRIQAAALFKERIGREKLIEGWVEGPCAMAADLRGINHLMTDFYDDPDFVRDLFEFVVRMEIEFARAQADAGVDLVGIGDAAASLVGPSIYSKFVLPFEKKLVEGIHAAGTKVRLHVCGNTRRILKGIGETRSEIVDLDYFSSLEEGRAQMGPEQVLAGNIHPVKLMLNGTPEGVGQAIASCHRGAGSRYIVAAGCEIPRGTPHENLVAMGEYARSHKPGQY